MNNEKFGIRASGSYAMYNSREYFALDLGDRVRLFSDDPPAPPFEASRKNWIAGEAVLAKEFLESLRKVQTTCLWLEHPFEVGIIVGDRANVFYLGNQFDQVCRLPGMERPDRFEVIGDVPVKELTRIEERVTDVPLTGRLHGKDDD